MNRRFIFIIALLILLIVVAACGGETPTAAPLPTNTPLPPTDTPLPPTNTPLPPTDTPPPPTPAPMSSLGLEDEAFRNEQSGYAIRYPQGWEHLVYEEVGADIFYDPTEPIGDIMGGDVLPEVPVVAITGGALDAAFDGQLEGVEDAQEVLDTLVAWVSDYDNFERGEVETITVGGETALAMDVAWNQDGVAAAGRYVAIHTGDRILAIQTIATVEGWEVFVPTFEAMLESVTLFEPAAEPLAITEEYAGKVDFSDPASVLQAVFTSAQTQDFSVLSSLCDPLGEHDGDAQLICDITDDHPDKDAFITYFAKAKIAGEAVIDGDQAQIPFLFGPNGDEEETMILIQRDGKWYLLSF